MTNVVLLVDGSGSMYPIKNQIIESINKLLTSEQNYRKVLYSMYTFNHNINTIFENQPSFELTGKNYDPNGATLLYDSLGYILRKYRNFDSVIIVIITDGIDNSSVCYNRKEIKDLVDAGIDKGYKFIYISTPATLYSSNYEEVIQGLDIGITSDKKDCFNINVENHNVLPTTIDFVKECIDDVVKCGGINVIPSNVKHDGIYSISEMIDSMDNMKI